MVAVLYVTVNIPSKCTPSSSCELLRVTFRVIELEFVSLHIALPSEEPAGLPLLQQDHLLRRKLDGKSRSDQKRRIRENL